MEKTIFLLLALPPVAFILKSSSIATSCFGTLLGIAIFFKTLFWGSIFITKGFKPSLWLYLIMAGAAMILISILIKTVFPMPILYNTLFYGAIALKLSGLILMSVSKIRKQCCRRYLNDLADKVFQTIINCD